MFSKLMNRVAINGKSYLDPLGQIESLRHRVEKLEDEIDGTRQLVGAWSAKAEEERVRADAEYRRGFEDGVAAATGNNALSDGAL